MDGATRRLSPEAGQKARAPRDTASARLGCPAAVPRPAATRRRLQYRAASTRRWCSGCQSNAAAKRRPLGGSGGALDGATRRLCLLKRARRPAHPEIRRRHGWDALLQFPGPRRHDAGCSTELPRHDGGALGARAFWPASAKATPPRSGDRWSGWAEHGRRYAPAVSPEAGQKARAPRDTASARLGCPAAVPRPAATRRRLQYRAASTRRWCSGCQSNAAAKRRPLGGLGGAWTALRAGCLLKRARRPAHPEIRRRHGWDALLQFPGPRRHGAGCSTELPRHDGGALGAKATPPRSGDRWSGWAEHGRRYAPAVSPEAGQKARAPRDTASARLGCPAAVPRTAATRRRLQYRAASTRRWCSGCQSNAAAKRRPLVGLGGALDGATRRLCLLKRARRPAHPEIRRRHGWDALLQFPGPRRHDIGCSTELPRHDGGALGARAFWPASAKATPPRSGDRYPRPAATTAATTARPQPLRFTRRRVRLR